MALAHGIVERRAGHAGHPVVAEDRRRRVIRADDRERLLAVGRDDRVVAEAAEDRARKSRIGGSSSTTRIRYRAAGAGAAGPDATGRAPPGGAAGTPAGVRRAGRVRSASSTSSSAWSCRSAGRRGSVLIRWLNATIAASRLPSSWATSAAAASRAGSRGGLSASGSCTRVSYDRVATSLPAHDPPAEVRPELPLTEEERLLRDTAREFATREVAPGAAERDEAERFDRSLFSRMGELGLTGAPLPDRSVEPASATSAGRSSWRSSARPTWPPR